MVVLVIVTDSASIAIDAVLVNMHHGHKGCDEIKTD